MAIIDFEFFMLIFLKKYAIIILRGKANKKTLLVIIVMKNKFKSIVTGYVKDMSVNRTFTVRVVFEDYSSTSYNKIYYIRDAKTRNCISSNAVEDRGYGTKIRLRVDRQGVGSMYANGWWSPDSTTCGW